MSPTQHLLDLIYILPCHIRKYNFKAKFPYFTHRYTRVCQTNKMRKEYFCTHINTIQGIIPHKVTSSVFFDLKTAGKEPLRPQREMETWLIQPSAGDEGLLGGVGRWGLMEQGGRLISTSEGRNCRRFLGDSRTASRFSLLFSLRTSRQRHTANNTTCGLRHAQTQAPKDHISPSTQFLPLGREEWAQHHPQKPKDSQA